MKTPNSNKKRAWVLQATIFSALRRAQRNSPAYREALNNAKEEYFIPTKKGTKARRVHFKCAKCVLFFSRKKINVDHIDPVIDPSTGFVSYDVYIERLFVVASKLQILCEACHKIKSKSENALRRAKKKASI